MTHSHTPTPEWDTFGDTLRHMAQLPNPTPAPSPQKGYVDGYRDMADVHASVGADGWESLADQASGLKMIAAEVG